MTRLQPASIAISSVTSVAEQRARDVSAPPALPPTAKVNVTDAPPADARIGAVPGSHASRVQVGGELAAGATSTRSSAGAQTLLEQQTFRLVEGATIAAEKVRSALLHYRPELRSAPVAEVDAAVEALFAHLPTLLRSALETAASTCNARVQSTPAGLVVSPSEPLALALDLCRVAAEPDGLGAALLLQALQAHPRGQAARALRFGKLLSERRSTDASVMLDRHGLSTPTRDALASAAQRVGMRVLQIGDTLLVGSGASLQLNVDVLLEGQALQDGALIAQEARIARFLSQRGIEVDTDYAQGSAGHYLPGDDSIGYVMPSRTNLNLLTHEATHARFEHFQQRLTSWLGAKGYAVPYEIDGEPDAMSVGYGSYMTLLNELNAHRVGNSFDGPVDDAEILQKLQELYRLTVGDKAADGFAATWPEKRVRGRSVPRLLLRAVRELNRIDTAKLLDLAEEGWKTQQPAPLINFLRLAAVRYRKSALPPDILAWARRCAEEGPSGTVRATAQQLLTESSASDDWHRAWQERRTAFDELTTSTQRWLRRVQAVTSSGFWPTSLLQRHALVLRYAAQKGLADYDVAVRELNVAYGDRLVASDGARRLFAQVMATPGADLDEKLESFACAWAGRPLDALWQELRTEPTEELKQLILGRHVGALDATKVRALVAWALDGREPAVVRQFAAEILGIVLDRAGLTPLGPGIEQVRREPDPERAPLSAELDAMLASRLLDGDAGIHRLRLIDMLQERIYPSELPRLTARLTRALTDDGALYNDHRLAAFFFLPESVDREPPLDWGRALCRAVLNDPTPNPRAAELATEFYRVAVSHALPGALEDPVHFDVASRSATEQAMASWSDASRALLTESIEDLWQLLASPLPQVGRGALYAIAAHPAFVVELEERLAGVLAGPPSPLRPRALRIALMLEPGFSTEVDASVPSLASPTAEEQSLLRALRG
ncbi:MAG: hypothetical protein AAB426_13345 [Myxococcota bacterium]